MNKRVYKLSKKRLTTIAIKDIRGTVFNKLLVQAPSDKRDPSNREVLWSCLCKCGKKCLISTSDLKKSSTCGCRISLKERVNQHSFFEPRIINKYLKRRNKEPIDQKDYHLYIDEFTNNGLQVDEISDKYKVYPDQIKNLINTHRTKLNQQYELDALANLQKFDNDIASIKIDQVLRRKFTTEELEKVCSDPESEELTEQEELFALLWSRTGALDISLTDSGFIEALKIKDAPRKKLLGMYLRSKPNIAKFIRRLQLAYLEDVKVSKSTVQGELLSQIEQLKESVATDGSSPSHRSNLIRTIELLGKTIGAFQDNLLVDSVKPSEAIKQIIEMGKVESEYSIEELEED